MRKSQEIKEELREMAGGIDNHTAHASYNLPETKTQMLKDAHLAGVAGLPGLLDVGQCNDVYSAIRIATALADAFDTDVNGLPLSLIVS